MTKCHQYKVIIWAQFLTLLDQTTPFKIMVMIQYCVHGRFQTTTTWNLKTDELEIGVLKKDDYLRSHKTLFAHNNRARYLIVVRFCKENNITNLFCAYVKKLWLNVISRDSSWGRVTHWRRATHTRVSKLTINDSGNGLAPGRHQAIIWTSAGILLLRNKLQWSFKRNACIYI